MKEKQYKLDKVDKEVATGAVHNRKASVAFKEQILKDALEEANKIADELVKKLNKI